MSVIPQAFRLTSGDGKMFSPSNMKKDFYPAPGEYEVSQLNSMTRNIPHYPLVKGSPKQFGTQLQRPSESLSLNANESPVRTMNPQPGPGAYTVSHQLASDLPGATKDYHKEYLLVTNNLIKGREDVAKEFKGVVRLSKESGGVFAENPDGSSKTSSPPSSSTTKTVPTPKEKPRDQTANRFKTPAPDPYTWMLGPGSYNDATFKLTKAINSKDKNGQTLKERNKLKLKNANWGKTKNIKVLEKNIKSIQFVSSDRLPSEEVLVGYKTDDKNKDFNKIYHDVSQSILKNNILRKKERKLKGWEKELEKMKKKQRKKLKLSKFKQPSTFSSAIRIDMDEDKKKLGTMYPGPGKYEVKSDFEVDSQQSILHEIHRLKKKMKLVSGVDLDNNGIDDGLEIEALLPATHLIQNTSSFVGEERDSLKFMNRYGKGGSNQDVPASNHYRPNYLNRSPAMYRSSFNSLAYVEEDLTYLGKKVKNASRSVTSDGKYDARGLSYDRTKKRSQHGIKKHLSSSTPDLPTLTSPSPSPLGRSSSSSSSSTAPSSSTAKVQKERSLSYHEIQRRPRSKSRHGLEEQPWFQHGSAPTIGHDRSVTKSIHNSQNMKRAVNEKKRLKIDTIKLGNVFFKTSPSKLRPKDEEWQTRLRDEV
jgi:hypothetical protein